MAPARHQVAIVGAGPAGKSVATELLREGAAVTLFEKEKETGGLLRYGYPSWRMPDSVSLRDAERLKKLGAKVITGQELGKDITLDQLTKDFKAVVLAIGAYQPKTLGIEGEKLPGVYQALSFLHGPRVGGPPSVGKRALIIGGGDTAMDVATTSLWLGAESAEIMYRRSEPEMPAQPHELEIAKDKGATFRFLQIPVKIMKEDGRLKVLIERTALKDPDHTGRKTPVLTGQQFTDTVDTVVVAIGQEPKHVLFESLGLTVNTDGTTNQPGVFVAGEMHYGADKLAKAILDGRRLAKLIMEHLR